MQTNKKDVVIEIFETEPDTLITLDQISKVLSFNGRSTKAGKEHARKVVNSAKKVLEKGNHRYLVPVLEDGDKRRIIGYALITNDYEYAAGDGNYTNFGQLLVSQFEKRKKKIIKEITSGEVQRGILEDIREKASLKLEDGTITLGAKLIEEENDR